MRHEFLEHAQALRLGLADRKAADRKARQAERQQGLERRAAQVAMHPALHDAEQHAGRGRAPVVVAAAQGPAHRAFHRQARGFVGCGISRAVVEGHHDVGAERALHIHRYFRREAHFGAVDRRTEAHSLLVDLAQFREAEHLEAARVREDRPLPVHEAVQVAVRGNHLRARPQHQVEGVAEHDLRTDAHELLGCHRLDGAVGADGHEGGRIDDAVAQREPAAARGAVAGQDFKLQRHALPPPIRAPAAGVMNMASP